MRNTSTIQKRQAQGFKAIYIFRMHAFSISLKINKDMYAI